MQYLEFIDMIDKKWNEKNNATLAREYSLNRSVLPALIKLNREWQKAYDLKTQEVDELELKLNHFKNFDNCQDIDYLETIKNLENKIEELELKIIELEEENINLENKLSFNSNNSLLQKFLG